MRNRRVRRAVVIVVCLLVIVGQGIGWMRAAAAQLPGGREQVRAMVHCDGETLTITIDNQFWNSIIVRTVSAFSGPVNPLFFPTGMDVDPGTKIAKQTWRAIVATVDVSARDRDSIDGAMIVTSAGVLMPTCDGRYQSLMDDPGDTPADIVDANRILDTAAMMTIGRLESLRAWDALYALLHPDVQALVSPVEMQCWFIDQFGTRDDPKESVQATTVDAIFALPDWEWVAGGITYRQAIQIDFTQQIGTLVSSHEVAGTMVFVEIDGNPFWFFGDRADSLDDLTTDCDR